MSLIAVSLEQLIYFFLTRYCLLPIPPENPSETPLSSWKAELFEQRRLRVLRDTGLVKNENKSKMKKRAFFIFFPLVFNMEGTDTGWITVLEKKGLHQAAGLLESYGIDSETDVSLFDQGDLRNLVSQGLKSMQLKKLEHWCEAVRARAEKTLPSSLNTLLLLLETDNRRQERGSAGANEDGAYFQPAACPGQQDLGV